MWKAIQFAMKYRNVIAEFIEFTALCVQTEGVGKTKSERSNLMKKYWKLVRSIQDS